MPNSYYETVEFDCLKCFQQFEAEIWLIVDTHERPDLVEKIRQESLHEVSCPRCGPIGQKDSALLIFRYDAEPHILFSPSQDGTQELNEHTAHELVIHLHDSLGTDWQDSWVSDGLPIVKRPMLNAILSDEPESTVVPPEFVQDLQISQETKQRYLQTGSLEALNQSVAAWQRIISHPSFQNAPKDFCLIAWADAGDLSQRRYWHTGAILDLDLAIDWWQKGVALAVNTSEHPKFLNYLSDGLRVRYERIGRVEDLDKSIRASQQAVALTPLDSPARHSRLNNLGNGLSNRYLRIGRPDDLNQAIRAWQEAIALTALDDPTRAMPLNNLGIGLRNRYLLTGQLDDLEEAIRVWKQAVALTPANVPDHARHLNNLGAGLSARYALTGQLQDLEDSIHVSRQAVALTGVNAPERAMYLDSLGEGLRERYLRFGQLQDLEDAIRSTQQAVALTSSEAPNRANILSNLGIVLILRYKHIGRVDDLEEAIHLWNQAMTLMVTDSPGQASILDKLATAMHERYERTGQLEDLDDAIRASRQAVSLTPTNAPVKARYSNNLGTGLGSRYERTGLLENLEEAIHIWGQTISLTPVDAPERATYFNNLGKGLSEHYLRTGRLEDLKEAIRASQESVDSTPADSPRLPPRLNNLGNQLRSYYERTGQFSDLEEAIRANKQAVALTPPDSPDRAMHLHSLGASLYLRYSRLGLLDDLEEAIHTIQQALDLTPASTPYHTKILTGLGAGLHAHYLRTRRVEYLEEAIRVWEQATALTPANAPERPHHLNNLGAGLRARYELTNRPSDLEDAKDCYQQACALSDQHSQQQLLMSSIAWGNWAFDRQSWQEANQAYAYGVKAIQNLYKAQFSRTGKESWIRTARGLSARAAYSLAKTGDLTAVLEVLEAGRTRLMSEALERARRDLELLADPAIGHKDLLKRYRTTSESYAGLAQIASNTGTLGEKSSVLHQNWIQQLESTQTEIDNIISEIRRVPGYETFLLSPTAAQIEQQAQSIPLIYLAVTPAGGLALIVSGEQIASVELPSLTENNLNQHMIGDKGQDTYLRVYLDWRADPYHDGKRETWKQALDQTMSWLWDTVMLPVIEHLQATLPTARQIILIPSDWLSLLPLHAAWTPDNTRACGRRYALDEFNFTYAPSALSLMRVREQAQKTPTEKLLVVENPDGSLHFSEPAAEAALVLFDEKTHLAKSAATFDAVRECFKDHNVLYFFTHGVARFDEPLESALVLADHHLTLRDIFDWRADHARLAVLSACETGIPSDLDLLDEAVSLPSGLMQAGVPGVVGTLWTVLEASTTILMAVFFEQLRKEDFSAPEALRKAQMIVRDAAHNKEAQNYFQESLPEGAMSSTDVADILHKELYIKDFDHPFYWAAFTYTGL
jgi:CHAT domain-containing protein/exonuclease VII small subunit